MNQSQAHIEYLRVAWVFTLGFDAVSLPLSALGGAIANEFLGGNSGWRTVLVLLFCGILIIVFVWVESVRVAQWLVKERELAQLDRVDAESNAIAATGKAGGIVQTNYAAPGSTLKAQVKAPRVSILGKKVSWNQITQINQPQPEIRRIEIPREDWTWMLEQFVNAGHSKRLFTSETLPYSGLPAYPHLYQLLIETLCKGEAIIGRGERASGTLRVKDVPALTKIVDQAHPKGITLELPATTNE